MVVVTTGAAGAGWVLLNRKPALPSGEVAAYLDAWERFDAEAMARLTDGAPPEMAEAITAMRDTLEVSAARFDRTGLRRSGDAAIAEYAATLDLSGLGPWSYNGTVELRRREGRWGVVWSSASLHPALGAG